MTVCHKIPASVISRLDPRTRFIVALAFTLTVSFSLDPVALAAASVVSVSVAYAARVDWRRMGQVLCVANLFLFFLALGLSLNVFGATGEALLNRDGLIFGAVIAARTNAILLAVAALVGTMEPAHLGLAMEQLRISSRFTQIFLFMIRYTEVIHTEYHRLRGAIAVRGFYPRWDRHTLRTYGYLIGMLLVRSFDRADRIRDAMKCRGFNGRFHVLFPFRFEQRDALFAVISIGFFVAILALDGHPQAGSLYHAAEKTFGIGSSIDYR